MSRKEIPLEELVGAANAPLNAVPTKPEVAIETPAAPTVVEPLHTPEQFCLSRGIKWHKAGGFLAEMAALYPGKRMKMAEWAEKYETYRARPVR